MMRIGFSILFYFSFAFFMLVVLGVPRIALADAASDIQRQIDANNAQIKSLEADIAAYQKELDVLGSKKNTLQSTISALTLSQKQLATRIKITQSKIASANLEIRELTLSIGDKEETIATDQGAIAKAIRSIAEGEREPLVATLISAKSFSHAWQATDEAVQFNRALAADIADLRVVRTELTANRDVVSKKKAELVALQNDLAIQKKSVEVSKAAQQQLLADTKNQESSYQKLVTKKRAQQAEFEAQLFKYESQLRQILDLSTIPTARVGTLFPPLAKLVITQNFGRTVDAKSLYVSGTHGGVDYKASIGTPVKAVLSGMVVDIESVKIKSGCQYGKWVLIKHANGLSTIYGHLSYVYARPGDVVTTGQIIGLSGDTGYSTGPHLHLGVYATAGVKIVDSSALGSVNCAGIKTVAASPDAYLNPLTYL
jgi:murein DD-endopeptidase MepM/ murein hydrolase activator NlpD